MTARNILFTDHAQGMGGAEHSLLLLMQNLDRERYHPILASPPGPLAHEATKRRFEHLPLDMPRLRNSATALWDGYGIARQLASLANANETDVLVSNTVRSSVYTALAARLSNKPFVWYMRDFWLSETKPTRPQVDRLGKSLLARSATRVISNSRAVAARLPQRDRVRVVHNGIDLIHYDPAQDGSDFRQQYNIPGMAPVVGMLGRLRPWKGQDRFLRAAATVAKAVPEAQFVVAGGTPLGLSDDYPDSLRTLASELGLNEKVVFTGHLDDVRSALAAMDLFVHPGDPEPFGLVNLEAMAMRLPVVAFHHGALPEIVIDQNSGILVSPGDLGALTHAISSLLQDPARMQVMGHNGREIVEKKFQIQRTAEGVEEVLDEVFHGRKDN